MALMIGVERTERSNNANATKSNIASGVAGRSMMTARQHRGSWQVATPEFVSRDGGGRDRSQAGESVAEEDKKGVSLEAAV